jgi:hypothetical protein
MHNLNYPDPAVYPEQYEFAGMLLPEDERSRVEDFAEMGLSPYLQEVGLPRGMYLGNMFAGLSGGERLCDWPILRKLPRALSAFVPCLEDEVPILARHFLMQGRRVETILLQKMLKWDGVQVTGWLLNFFDLFRGKNGEALVDPCGALCKGWMGRCAGRKGLIVNRHGADVSERLAYKLRSISLFLVERERDRTGNPRCASPSEEVLPRFLQQDAERIHQQIRSASLRFADPETRKFIRDEFPSLPHNRKLREAELKDLQEEIRLLRAACEWLRESIRKRKSVGVPLVTDKNTRLRIEEMRTNAESTIVLIPLPAVDFQQPSWLNYSLSLLFTYTRLVGQNTSGKPWVWFVPDEALGGFNNLPALMMEKSPPNDMGVVVALHTERLMTLQYELDLAKHIFWASGTFVCNPDGIGGMFADELMFRSGKAPFRTESRSIALREWLAFSGMNFSEGETTDWVWFPQANQSAFRRFWQNRDIHKMVYGVQVGIHILPFIIEAPYVDDPAEQLSDGQTALMLARQKQKKAALSDADLQRIAPSLPLPAVGVVQVPTPPARKAMEAAAHHLRAVFPMLGNRGPLLQELAAAQKTEKWAFWVALPVLAALGVAAKLLHLW